MKLLRIIFCQIKRSCRLEWILLLDQNKQLRCNIIKFSIQFYMDYYNNSRLAYELQLQRILQLERQSQLAAAVQSLRITQAREMEAREIIQIQRLKQEQEFWNYQIIKNAQLLAAKKGVAQERLILAEKQKQYESLVEDGRRSRLCKQEEPDPQKRILYSQQRKKSRAQFASRKAQQDTKIRLKEQIQRENNYLLQQQQIQQKLRKQLKEIDQQIGTIYNARDQRKKKQLEQLEILEEKIFKIRQQLRASRVTQLALQQELLRFSKLIL